MGNTNAKRYSEACERNKNFIFEVLKIYFPPHAKILEIASGTGQHADFFTSKMPTWIWQCSDMENTCLNSINNYRNDSKSSNFLQPLKLSTLDSAWNTGEYDAAICCNMIHISPWESTVGLFKHLSKHIKLNGILAIYGPFLRQEVSTAPSNLAFDSHLREINPAFGIRDLSIVINLAVKNRFFPQKIIEMPAHNLMVIFRQQ